MVDNTPPERPRVPHLEVDDPGQLKEGQNFFDQEPFKSEIEIQSKKFGVDEVSMRRLLKRLAEPTFSKKDPSPLFTGKNPEKIKHELSHAGVAHDRWTYHFKRVAGLQSDSTNISSKESLEIATSTFSRLLRFPYWLDYVNGQFQHAYYQLAGNFDPKSPYTAPTETYLTWVAKKLTLEERTKMAGIEEIFPQQNVQDAVRNTGKATRKWRILGMAEILREM